MRLLAITNVFPPALGGIENFIFSLVSRWGSGEVVVLAPRTPGCDAFDRDLPFEVVRAPVGALVPSPAAYRRVSDLISSHSIDALHFASPLPFLLLGTALRRRRGVPYAVSLHGGDFLLPAALPVGKSILRTALLSASLILPNSSFTERQARKFLDGRGDRMTVLTPGVDTEMFVPSAKTREREGPVIVSVCRMVSRKGPATLLKAMPRILRRHPDTRMVIVGGGPDLGRLRRLASAMDLNGSVTFTGGVPWHQLPPYYAAADIFAHPTRERFNGLETEGFGLVYLEAASCGLPAVAGQAGGVQDAVIDGETGFIVNGKGAFSCGEAILTLLDDPGLARSMGAKARARALEEFRWDTVAGRFREAMEKHLS